MADGGRQRAGAGPDDGVVFPAGPDGRRSSATTGREVWADAVRDVDADLAARIRATGDWRRGYLTAVVAHTQAAARTAEGSLRVAHAGLDALAARMVFVRDGQSAPLAEAVRTPGPELTAEQLHGSGERVRELVVPYRGRDLHGADLLRQLESWVARGVLEPSAGDALRAVVQDPSVLDVSGRAFALLGAGAELGPLAPLLSWGAHVVAVDVPSPRIWDRLRRVVATSAGTLTVVCSAPGVPGVDLLTQTPEVAAFLRTAAPGLPLTTGSYAYADGARHVQVVHASDAVVELLLRERPGTSYAELATPTDAFAVPVAVVDDARRRYAARGLWGPLQAPARRAGLYLPAYPATFRREDGAELGIADVLVPQQGPNYTLAKRVQRWRAVVAQADGHVVSAGVAPATRTRSVTKNRLLAAAYAGAGRFGVEVFAPETSRVLMAALLVRDLQVAAPAPAFPDDLFSSAACHGGLWRVGYSPRSVLGVAAVAGLPAAVR